jgi:CRP-like cAMP-binding protein
MNDYIWYLKNCDLFERLAPDQIQKIESRSRSRKFNRGDLIYLPSDQSNSMLLLTSGRVKIYHLTSDGKQTLMAIIEPGELFGELGIFEEGRREEFAEPMIASSVVLIPNDLVQELMESFPQVTMGVTRLMGLRRKRVERRLKSLLFRSNRDRLVYLLLELSEKYGKPVQDGVLISLKLSHQELASLIGSTRETVTVVLGELQQEGLLVIQRRQVVLRRVETLASSIDVPTPKMPTGNQLHQSSQGNSGQSR